MNEFILIFDSGSGGKFVLSEFKKVMPQENYILFCDKYNCPYGNKNFLKLKSIVVGTLQKLISIYKIKLIVIACNTISSLLKGEILKIFKTYKILFVEPKLTKQMLKNPTLLLATTNTIKNNKNIRKNLSNPNLYLQGFATLALKIDNFENDFIIREILKKKLVKFKKYNIQNVVLGCTHYNFIKNEINNIFEKELNFFENSKNIAKKAKKTLEKMNNLVEKNEHSKTIILYSI